jgi:hypothetical protein
MDKLLPCPFCGSEAEIKHTGDTGRYVCCTNCNSGSHLHYGNLDELAKKWNTRQQLAKPAVEWISCKDRLPEPHRFVDVIISSNENSEYQTRRCDILHRQNGDFNFKRSHPAEYVSHWKLIPSLPAAYDALQDK